MAKYSLTLNASTTSPGVALCNIVKKRDMPQWYYTVMGYGTYGGGTLTWYVSPDKGTTVIPMTDLTDTALSMTQNKMFDGSLCASSNNTDRLQMWVQLTGATTPSLTVSVYCND